MEEEYYEALTKCGKRYITMLNNVIEVNNHYGWHRSKAASESVYGLLRFVQEFTQGCENKLPLMKLNRWLGYIQGSLIQWEMTTVEKERNWTRPLFRHLDFNAGMVESVDAEDSKSFVERRGGSSPSTRTNLEEQSKWRDLLTDPPTGNEYGVLLFPCKSDCGILYTTSNPDYARGKYAQEAGFTHWCEIELAPTHEEWVQWQIDINQ